MATTDMYALAQGPQARAYTYIYIYIYIRLILSGHGISYILQYTHQKVAKARRDHIISFRSWVYKTWAVASQNVLDTLHGCIDSLLERDCGFWLC